MTFTVYCICRTVLEYQCT